MHQFSNLYKSIAVISCFLCVFLVIKLSAQFPSGNEKIPNNIAHERAACIGCHNIFASIDESFDFQENRTQACKTCHNDLKSNNSNSLSFHTQEKKQCLDCHSYHKSNQISAGESVLNYNFDDPLVDNHCINCHAPERKLENLLVGHFEASKFYHDNTIPLSSLTPSEACLSCHSYNSNLADKYSSPTTPRFFEHASHIYGQSYIPYVGAYGFSLQMPNDTLIKLVDGKIECQTCHSLTSQNTKLLVLDQPDGQICVSCHIRNEY